MLILESLYNYDGKPDLSQFGVRPMCTNDRGFFKQTGPDQYDQTTGDEASTRALARAVATQKVPLCLDIENGMGPSWRFDMRTDGQSAVVQSIARLQEIIDWIRDEQANTRLGWYGDGFYDTYWAPNNADPKVMQSFEAAHAQVRHRMLFQLDFTAPSLYAFYADLAGWKKMASETLAMARAWGIQVYAYLWPEFHDGGPLAGQFIPPEMWEAMLTFCFERINNIPRADAVVIWSGGKKRQWDDNLPWWQVTKKFLPPPAAAA